MNGLAGGAPVHDARLVARDGRRDVRDGSQVLTVLSVRGQLGVCGPVVEERLAGLGVELQHPEASVPHVRIRSLLAARSKVREGQRWTPRAGVVRRRRCCGRRAARVLPDPRRQGERDAERVLVPHRVRIRERIVRVEEQKPFEDLPVPGPVEDNLPRLGLERLRLGVGHPPRVGRLQVQQLPQRHRLVPKVVPEDVAVRCVGLRVEQCLGVEQGGAVGVHEDQRLERRRIDGEDLELVAELPPASSRLQRHMVRRVLDLFEVHEGDVVKGGGKVLARCRSELGLAVVSNDHRQPASRRVAQRMDDDVCVQNCARTPGRDDDAPISRLIPKVRFPPPPDGITRLEVFSKRLHPRSKGVRRHGFTLDRL